jgi:hypothetical protein
MGAITLRKRRINATAISTHVENAWTKLIS